MPAFNHFPCEIFKEIILYTYPYILEPVEYDGPQLDLQVLSPPIVASHVCRSWRHTLLRDSTMWTCLLIPEMKSEGIMELLRRSGSSALNVFIELNSANYYRQLRGYGDTDVLSTLFQEMHRFKVFRLQIDRDTIPSFYTPEYPLAEQILSSVQRPAPQLQTFYFRNSDDSIDEAFLDTLFSGDAPNLKSIYYLPSDNFLEVNYPLFHNLSELYISLPCHSTLDFGRFLDLLELSPRLKLLFFEFGWDKASLEGSLRIVDLPCLQRLVLVTHLTMDIVESILEYVQVPSTFKWAVSAHRLMERADSEPSSLLGLMSQAHFTSLDIALTPHGPIYLILEEQDGNSVHCTNQFDGNRLAYSYEDTSLLKFWKPLVDSIVPSTITCFELVVQYVGLFDKVNTMLSIILGTIGSLEFLTIRHDPDSCFGINRLEAIFVCLSALVPDPEQVEAFKCRPNTENPAPDPDLDPISTNDADVDSISTDDSESDFSTDDSEGDSSTDSGQPWLTSEGTYQPKPVAFPCPRLRELTVAMDGRLDMMCAVMLRTCYTRRREEGYPLEIFVHSPGMKEMVASILQLETSDIHVSSDPLD